MLDNFVVGNCEFTYIVKSLCVREEKKMMDSIIIIIIIMFGVGRRTKESSGSKAKCNYNLYM